MPTPRKKPRARRDRPVDPLPEPPPPKTDDPAKDKTTIEDGVLQPPPVGD
jgi:hypothetical protein